MQHQRSSIAFRVMTWNLCRGFNVRRSDDFNWQVRVESILNVIRREEAGILVFQECRIWDINDGEMVAFVAALSTMGYHCIQFEPNAGAAGGLVLMICFKRGEFLMRSTETLWLSDEEDLTIPSFKGRGNEWGKIVGCVTLTPIRPGDILPRGNSVTVCNVHLSLHPGDKAADIELLNSLPSRKKGRAMIVAGDFNLFDDEPTTKENMQQLLDGPFTNVQEGQPDRRGTWLGHARDYPVEAGNTGAELDLMLFTGPGLAKDGDAQVIVPNASEQRPLADGSVSAHNNWASDHAPIVATFIFE